MKKTTYILIVLIVATFALPVIGIAALSSIMKSKVDEMKDWQSERSWEYDSSDAIQDTDTLYTVFDEEKGVLIDMDTTDGMNISIIDK